MEKKHKATKIDRNGDLKNAIKEKDTLLSGSCSKQRMKREKVGKWQGTSEGFISVHFVAHAPLVNFMRVIEFILVQNKELKPLFAGINDF